MEVKTVKCPHNNCDFETDHLAPMELHQNIIHDSTIIIEKGEYLIVKIEE